MFWDSSFMLGSVRNALKCRYFFLSFINTVRCKIQFYGRNKPHKHLSSSTHAVPHTHTHSSFIDSFSANDKQGINSAVPQTISASEHPVTTPCFNHFYSPVYFIQRLLGRGCASNGILHYTSPRLSSILQGRIRLCREDSER